MLHPPACLAMDNNAVVAILEQIQHPAKILTKMNGIYFSNHLKPLHHRP